jgi:nitrite reductase/ring-hydroxylating ferredoxin subunit
MGDGTWAATFVPVVAAEELREGMVELYEVEGRTVALVRTADGVCALDGICTHAHFCLGPGRLVNGRIECPMHMSQFDPADGSVRKGPAAKPLETFETQVRDGTVYVAVDWI